MKRILALVLALAMTLTVTGVAAFAQDTGPAGLSLGVSTLGRSAMALPKNSGAVTATVRVELKDGTFLEPTEVSLTGLTYDDYGVWDSASADFAPIPDPGFQTPLHALLEALAQYMVDDGAAADLEEARPYAGSMLDVSNGGYGVYLNSVNGSSHPADGYYYTYMVGNAPGSVGIGAYELQEGDSVVISESWSSYPTPAYAAYFDKDVVNTAAGNTFVLTLKGTDTMAWPVPDPVPLPGADIYVDGNPAGKTTDRSGRAVLSFDDPGTYVISAQRTAATVDSDISRPYCKVVVAEAPASDDKAAVEAAIAGLPSSFAATTYTGDIELPYTDPATGAAITWSSSHPEVVSCDGGVTRPGLGEVDAVVTLTATVSKGTASGIWSIDVTIPAWTAEEQRAALDLAADIAALPAPSQLTLANERQVDALLLRYAALGPVQQAWVSNYDVLLAAKARIDELLEEGGQLPSSSWPMLRGGPDNMAVIRAATPQSASSTELKWESWFGGQLDSWGSGYSGQPILVGDAIFIPRNHQLQKLDKSTGEIIKAEATAAPLSYNSYAAYGGGRIYVPLTGGRLQAFDAVTLRSLWVNDDGGSGINGLSAVLYADEVVYTGFTDFSGGSFAAYDAATGSRLWSHDGPSYYWAGAALAGGHVVFGGDDGVLVSADAKTGAVADTLDAGASIRSAVSYAAGSVYLTTSAGRVLKVPVGSDGTFGESVFADLPYSITATPAVYGGKVYIPAYDADYSVNGGKLYILEEDDLTVAASADLPGDSQSSPLVAVGGDGKVRAYVTLNDSTGALACGTWDGNSLKVETIFAPSHPNYCNRSPIAGEDGVIYYSNDAGYLYAVASGRGQEPDEDEESGRGGGMSGYWEKDRLTTEKLLEEMENAYFAGDKNIVLGMRDTLMVKGEVFRELKKLGAAHTLTLDCGTHTWTMAASQVPESPADLRLSLVQQNYRDDLEELLGRGSDYLALHFDHSGPLPGPMSVVLRLPSALREKTLFLYRADGNGYVQMPGALLASGEHCLMNLSQGGDYLITTQVLGETVFAATPNPTTGGMPATFLLGAAQAAVSAAAAAAG